MRRHLTWGAAAAAGALALAGTAAADGGDGHGHGANGAKVYRATLVATDAAATAQLPDVRGFAQLVDGKKHDKVSIHVRGLKPGETYPWHVHKAKDTTHDPCATGSPAANPTPYPGWTYTTLKANADGNASAKGVSTTFDSRKDSGVFYVNVHLADGTVIACGVLKGKKSHAKSHDQYADPTPHKSVQGEAHGRGPKPRA